MATSTSHLAEGATVLVTGATGFVGGFVCASLNDAGFRVRILSRSTASHPFAEVVQFKGFDDADALDRATQGVSAVVHLAARVHIMRDRSPDPLAAFRAVNVHATRAVAEAAARNGVQTFVMTSSVKAVGESNVTPWDENVVPAPRDPYGISKLEAEAAVQEIAGTTGMRAIVLRLPLVYGPGVKANFLRLFDSVQRGLPLPFGGIRNRRSLVYVENVAFAITGLLQKPHASGIFFVSDGSDMSTSELIRRIGKALRRRVILLPAPTALMRLAGAVGDRLPAGVPIKSSTFDRLIGSLAVDSGKLVRTLGTPLPFDPDAGLQRTAEWYRTKRN